MCLLLFLRLSLAAAFFTLVDKSFQAGNQLVNSVVARSHAGTPVRTFPSQSFRLPRLRRLLRSHRGALRAVCRVRRLLEHAAQVSGPFRLVLQVRAFVLRLLWVGENVLDLHHGREVHANLRQLLTQLSVLPVSLAQRLQCVLHLHIADAACTTTPRKNSRRA